MKFIIFAILYIQLGDIKYIHIVMQPSPASISMTLSSPPTLSMSYIRAVSAEV